MEPAAPDPWERRRQQTRADILAAAWRLAERDGIAGLTLRDLAREVGMRAPSLYTYFDSKGAIHDAMFAEGYRQLLAEVEAWEQDGWDPTDRVGSLTRVLEHFLTFCQASLPRYQLMFTRVLPDWEPSPEAYAPSVEQYARLRDRFAELGLDDRRSLDLWTALSSGMAAQQVANDPNGDRWRVLAHDAVAMFLALHDRTGSPS